MCVVTSCHFFLDPSTDMRVLLAISNGAILLELLPNLNQHKYLLLGQPSMLFILVLRHRTFSRNKGPRIWLVHLVTESHRIFPTLGQYMVAWSEKSRLQPQCDPALTSFKKYSKFVKRGIRFPRDPKTQQTKSFIDF